MKILLVIFLFINSFFCFSINEFDFASKADLFRVVADKGKAELSNYDTKNVKGLKIDYSFEKLGDPKVSYISIQRTDFARQDFSEYTGLIIKLNVLNNNDKVRFKLSFFDESTKSGDYNQELWEIELSTTRGWQIIQIPFDKFKIPIWWEEFNDKIFNLSGIIKFEINMVKKDSSENSGNLIIDEIIFYKKEQPLIVVNNFEKTEEYVTGLASGITIDDDNKAYYVIGYKQISNGKFSPIKKI